MKLNLSLIALIAWLISACAPEQQANTSEKPAPTFQNKGHELVYKMVQKVGNHEKLSRLQNVQYTYTYQTPNQQSDISTEKYLFDGELSYGHYLTHERTFPQLEGEIEQGYDGQTYWLKHNGTLLSDSTLLQMVAFNRPTNYYWFAMMPKLLDPGLTYEYLGETLIDAKVYDIVKVGFQSEHDKPTDIYQLYLNRETSLADQFLFTVADFDVMETPLLMQVTYEEIEGLLIPTKRQYKKSTWNADVTDQPWVKVTWSDIKFNTAISQQDFQP